MKYTVYLRTNLINGKQYVGQTKKFKEREKQWKCLTTRYANFHITDEREKYGLENFKTEILAITETREEAWDLEKKYINELNTKFPKGYNKSDGGKDSTGTKYSIETKEKLSLSHKGMHNSPETEWKKGCESSFKGKQHSKESKEKNRLAHLGKESKKRMPVVQLTIDGNLIKEYTHCESASKEMGFKSDESIRKACKESWRTSGGYKWMYKEDYEKMLGV